MDRPPDPTTCLPLDLDQVLKILPTLISISTELDSIPQRYRELDHLFRQHFLALFDGHDSRVQVHERLRASLNRLHDLTQNSELIEKHLYWLELNNDRTVLAYNMLTMLCQPPLRLGEADDNT